jgi:hypothetical protein
MKWRIRMVISMKKPVDIILESFTKLPLGKMVQVPIIAIYKSPKDYPGKYVARLWDIRNRPTIYVTVANTLDIIREGIPRNMHRLPPFPSDDPVLVETWI